MSEGGPPRMELADNFMQFFSSHEKRFNFPDKKSIIHPNFSPRKEVQSHEMDILTL
jgi:hypothetical protein